MSEHGHGPAGPTDAGYETTDANAGSLARWGVALAAIVVAGFLVSKALVGLFADDRTERSPGEHPLRELRAGPSGPRLQPDNEGEYGAYRAEMERSTSEYAWIDTVEGVVRIPVERAAELALERGFETREDAR